MENRNQESGMGMEQNSWSIQNDSFDLIGYEKGEVDHRLSNSSSFREIEIRNNSFETDMIQSQTQEDFTQEQQASFSDYTGEAEVSFRLIDNQTKYNTEKLSQIQTYRDENFNLKKRKLEKSATYLETSATEN